MIPIRKQHVTVNKFFDSITETQLENFNILKDNTVIVSGNTIKLTLKQMFGNFEILHSDSIEETIGYWNNFKTVYRNTFSRIYDALTAEYNVLDNYDKTSTITITGTGNSTVNNTMTNKETTEDSALFHDVSNSVGSNTTTASNSNTTTERTTGNIGVVSSMGMISQEYKGRIEMNLVKIICELYAEMELI